MEFEFSPGLRVRLNHHCPIESEGVAPAPGDEGELLARPQAGDRRRCWTVRFDRYSLDWRLPEISPAEYPNMTSAVLFQKTTAPRRSV